MNKNPNMTNPAQDNSLSSSERDYAGDMVVSLVEMIAKAEEMADDHFHQQGVPFDIACRVMVHATKHRTAMAVAHYLAGIKATDQQAKAAVKELTDDLAALIIWQLPNSRAVVAKIDMREQL